MSVPVLVPGRGRVPYSREIIGNYFFYKGQVVRAVKLQGGASQVLVMDNDKGIVVGYPSVDQLTPAVPPEDKDVYVYPLRTTLAERCDELEEKIETLSSQYQDLLKKYEAVLLAIEKK